MSDEEAGLPWLVEGDFARLDGLPFEDEPSDWHVNEHMTFSVGDEALESFLKAIAEGPDAVEGVIGGYVFQRGDASAEWLVLIVEGGEIQRSFRSMSTLAEPDEFDGSAIEVVSIADTLGDLDG